jgi:hypothetical protein
MKWLFAALLVLQAHFAASYLVPLDRQAQGEFGGLLRWAWPWSIGDGGLLGRIPASGEYPISVRSLARWGRSIDVYPRGAGSGGVVGSVWVVEGFGYGRSYPLAPAHGGLLRSDKGAADGP